jgi:signal transduction histidine kinase
MKPIRNRSLFSVLFVSVASAALGVYPILQFMMPSGSDASVALHQRFTLTYIQAMLRDAPPAVAIFIALVAAIIWIVLKRTLAPIHRLSDQALKIGPADLSQRLPLSDAPSEIVPLVTSFNTILDRLEDAWAVQKAFSANAAHELRTPLAALRAQVESLLEPAHRAEAVVEFDRLSRLISQLLVLSEGEHGPLSLQHPFDLAQTVTDVTKDCAVAFVKSGRRIAMETLPKKLERRGDPVLVAAAVRNLLDNALKHTPVGSTVTVGLDPAGVISVDDDGTGLSADFAARAFQPFRRADPTSAGAGLGLSIVARVAALHGGRAWLEPSDQGARFRIEIPRTPT